MGYWIKNFADGTRYIGDDHNPSTSWLHSRNNDIVSVELVYDHCYLGIVGPGEYWQSDLMEASFPDGKPTILARSIQRAITSQDYCFTREIANKHMRVQIFGQGAGPSSGIPVILAPFVGKWLTLSYSASNQLASLTMRNSRL